MRTRKIQSSQNKQQAIRREREPLPRKYFVLTAICSLILVAGFFVAARQHFASIDYGIKNAKLKKQVDDLKSEQRRLQLNKEIALSPGEIKKSAKRIGFTEMTANNIQSFKAERVSFTESAEKPISELSLNKADDKLEDKDRIKQTVSQKPVIEPKKVESNEEKVKKS
jgi:cell division protein FtsL